MYCNNNLDIAHKFRNNGEIIIGFHGVDGIDYRRKEIFEFDGCYWHSCTDCSHAKSHSQEEREMRCYNTEQKHRCLTELGFTVIHKKECEFDEEFAQDERLQKFYEENFELPHHTANTKRGIGMSTKELLDKIASGEFQGFVECSVRVRREDYSKHDAWPPVVKNALVSQETVSGW